MTPGPLARLCARPLSSLVRGYRYAVSPLLGPSCRYQPTCSEYALEALARFGAWRGTALALRRIGRCHPWGGSGHDPVPERPAPPDRAGAGDRSSL